MRTAHWLAAIAPPITCALVTALACTGARAPEPPYGTYPSAVAEGTCVPYPPPAARVEELPPRPSEHAVWIDGQWLWRARRWVWRGGEWQEPPEGSFYARAYLDRTANGALVFHPGHWHVRDRKDRNPGNLAASAVCPEPVGPPEIPVPDASTPAHVGPVLVYLPDAPSSAPPQLVVDATIPGELVQPPE